MTNIPAIARSLTAILPAHKAELSITHNQHLSYYATVRQEIEDRPDWYDDDSFVSAEDRDRCITTNEIWTLQWYPETPVGFNTLHASSLEVLLTHCQHLLENDR